MRRPGVPHPRRLELDYTEHLSRGLVLVKSCLAGLLVLIAAIALAFSAPYPRGIFDFVMGMNRWTVRVTAYAALVRDEYPPFRLDMGGEERPNLRPAEARADPPA